MKRFFLSFAGLFLSQQLFADLDLSVRRGEQVVEHKDSSGAYSTEICVVPKHFPKAEYDEENREKEKKLCAFDFHNEQSLQLDNIVTVPTATCAKVKSTNPATEIFSISKSQTKSQLEALNCKPKEAKKLAKYKISTSCSYTPSILGYYHLSRTLGTRGHVPVAVLRTMDQNFHIEMATTGVRLTQGIEPLNSNWAFLLKGLQGRGGDKFDQNVLTGNGQSFGALYLNANDEEFYEEFFNKGTDRAAAFRDRNPYYQLLSSSEPLSSRVGSQLSSANLQQVVAVRDVSEMIILDYLMSQQDRFGNIDAIEYLYYVDQEGDVQKMKKIKASKENQEKIKGRKTFKIKEMLIQDNDCGGSLKVNIAKKAGLLEGLNHLNPGVYKRLLWLSSIIDRPEVQKFFKDEVLFQAADLKMLRTNLGEIMAELREKCRRGTLHLDLDVNQHFFGQGTSPMVSCQP